MLKEFVGVTILHTCTNTKRTSLMSSVSSASHGSSSGTMIASLKVKQDLKEDGEKVKSSRQWHMRTILLDATHISIYPKSTPFSTSKHVIPLAKAPIAAATAARLPHYKARYTTAHTLFRVTFLTGASWLLECKTDLDCVSWIHAINTAALRAAESGVASLGREILSLRSDIVRSAGWPDASGTADIQRLSLDTQRWIASLSTKVEALQQELRLCRKYLEKEGGEDARQLVRASYQTSGCHSRAWSNGSEQSNSLSWGTESVKSVCPSIVPSQTETVGSKRVPKNTLAGITGSTASRRPVMERKYSPQLTYGLDYRSATATRAIVLIQQSKRGTSLLDVDTSTVEPCEQQAATSITPLVHQPTPLREEDDQNEQTAPSSSFAMQLKSVKLRNVSGTSSATSSATTQTQATLGAEARSCSESTLSFSEEIQRLQLRPVSCSSVQPTAISRDIATASRSSSAVSHSMADEIKNTRLRRTADETIMHSQPGEYHGRSTGLVHTEHGGVKPPICESILEKTQDVRLEAGCGMKECSDDQERANGNLSLADQILRVKLKRVKPGETDISMRTSSTNVTNDKMRRLEVDGMLNVRKFQPESRPQRLETSTPLSLIEEIGRIQLRKVHSMVAVTSEECSRAHEPMPPATSMSPQRPQIWRMQSSNATLRIASEVELSANKEEKRRKRIKLSMKTADHTGKMTVQPREPTTQINWSEPLGFKYRHPRSHIKYVWTKETGWDEGRLISEHNITMDIASTVLHYGQACFEGMKAFRMRDGKIRIFRPQLNAKRLQESCAAASMQSPSEDLFLDALKRVLSDNLDYVPPTDSNGSLYIRPFVIGSGPQLGLSPSHEFSFIILVNPVGPYYAGGLGSPVKAIIADSLDRAAPHGTGHVKVGGNYAPVFATTASANAKGYVVNLFLDPETHTKVEEFATSNFAALKRDADGALVYVTPRSESILKGVTNRSCAELASRHLGWKVERRDILWTEVSKFQEVVATGTAVVMTAIGEIHREVKHAGKRIKKNQGTASKFYDWDADDEEEVGAKLELEVVKFENEPVEFKKLYGAVVDLQKGDLKGWQEYEWMWPAEGL